LEVSFPGGIDDEGAGDQDGVDEDFG